MKKRYQLLACFCAAILAATGSTFPASASQLSPTRIWGPVTKESDSRLTIDNHSSSSSSGAIVINLSEETKILDAVSGMPLSLDQISDGESVYAYVGPAMTMSLPPQTSSPVVLARIPADFKVPDYIEVASMEKNGSGYTLTSVDGLTFQVPDTCSITPYLTRNMLVLENLYPGAHCLVWSDASNTASKIMMFQPYAPGSQENQSGWILTSGTAGTSDAEWTYKNADGSLAYGWLQDNGKWYYLNPETGIMERGFIQVDGKTYYMTADGSMLTSAHTFTPDSTGALY